MSISILEIMNPWWQDPAAIHRDPTLVEIRGRPYYYDTPLKNRISLNAHHATILRGCRQVGKTTLLKEKILEAIETKLVEAANCLYFSCEAVAGFEQLIGLVTPWLSVRKESKTLLCLDEITFVKEWQRAVLWFFNSGLLQNTTLLVTGSSARDLAINSERFPGRPVEEITVHPVPYHDYGTIPCFSGRTPSELLSLYFRVGGFPHAIRDFATLGSVTDETYGIYGNWIFGDAHRFDLTRDLLVHILFRIYDTSSSQTTWQRLLEKTPIVSHVTAAAYVNHLEQSHLCNVLHCYDNEKQMAAPRKAKKIYYIDPLVYAFAGGYLRGIRNVYGWWCNMLESSELRGNLFESVVVTHICQHIWPLYYWYSSNLKREVDVLVVRGNELIPFEIKLKHESIRPVLGRPVSVVTPELFCSKEDFFRQFSFTQL